MEVIVLGQIDEVKDGVSRVNQLDCGVLAA